MQFLVVVLLALVFVAVSLSRGAQRQRTAVEERWGDLERRLVEQNEALGQLTQRLERLEQVAADEAERA